MSRWILLGDVQSAFLQSLYFKGSWDLEFQLSSDRKTSIAWRYFAAPLCSIVHALAACICWLLVVLLPMATVNVFMLRSLWDFKYAVPDLLRRPTYLLNVRFASWRYFAYSVHGVNIVMLNLSLMVIPLVVRGYAPSTPNWFSSQYNCTLYFVLGFIAVIPLGSFVHMSLKELCSTTKPLYGFVANAIFHAIIEISVYIYILDRANNELDFDQRDIANALVVDRLLGSIMFNLAFIPGAAMFLGGLVYKQQEFNVFQFSANNVILFISICLFAMPTLFYHFIAKDLLSTLQ